MKTQELTPQLALALFPASTMYQVDGNMVSYPMQSHLPQNCEIIFSGVNEPSSKIWGQNTYYLVRKDSTLVYLRVCSNMPDCSFERFGVILGVANSEAGKELLVEKTRSYVEKLCGRVIDHVAA